MSATSGREATCPSCGKTFDPMRSRHVRVKDGRVMAFCSEACKAADVVALPPVMAETTKLPASYVPPAAAEPKRAAATKAVPAPAPVPVAVPAPATVEVADDVVEEVPRLRPRRRWRAALAALAVIVVGGMAIALVQNISPSSPSRVNAAPADRELPPAPAVPAAPVPSPREKATAVLKGLIASPSPRIARSAALALARTCDAAAKTHLVEATKTETSEIARLENAYVLARCGDDAAKQTLVVSLKNARRDVKADAARHLTALGDSSGLSFLHALLGVSQHRLGAAEALARTKDEKAVAALTTIHGAAGTEPDDKLRASIALGLAGDVSVKEELRIALADPRFRPAAAGALAELGDDFARDALVDGLGVPSLRVDAARALRRLSPNLDATPLVAPLLDALATERDNSQVSAAEAVLVLTGPAADAEKP
ncbi:MAG TPA: hypothetical protein VM261_38655 [Kofleriaceae bacterium]|nr:hypothetical protein [Kofleriaceae bacterium]